MTIAKGLTAEKNKKIAVALAFAGSVSPFPLAWLHKFYVGQYGWGLIYLVLAPTALPKVASGLEGIWYLAQSDERFLRRFPKAGAALQLVGVGTVTDDAQSNAAEAAQKVAIALRDLDQLRKDGLITEYEFEQKRRSLLDKIE